MDFLLDKIIVIILQLRFEQFMQDLAHSILKTQHSYLSAPSVKDQRQYNEINERAEQLRSILQWVNKKVSLFSTNRVEGINKPVNQYSFYMVKIESINGLVYRKVSPYSKVFITLIGKLYNHRTGQVYPKSIRIVRLLEEASAYVYELRDPFCFYFYSSIQKDLNIKVQVLLSEQEVKIEGNVGVFTEHENAGMIEIDLKQDHKGKQKTALILPNYFALGKDTFKDLHMNSTATANIICSKSDAYKYLERIVPQNVMCDSKDRIAGVMGYFLPVSENALADFAITPEAQSITFNFTSIEINSSLLKDAPHKAQNLVKNKISNLTKVTSSIKDLILRVYFHNSWKVISQASSLLHQKNQPNLKTNQSNISELNNNQNRRKSKQFIPSLAKINDQGRTKGSFKNYNANQALHLKLVFPQQDQCVIIYQIVSDVVVRGQIESENKKDAVDYIEQNIEIPVCFGVNSAKAISNYRAMNCIMNSGGCLVSFNDLKLAIELGLKQINSYKRITTSKAFAESKPKLPSFGGDFDIVSNNNRATKTIGNISQVSASGARGEIGFLQFQMQLSENGDIPMGNEQNNSILQNFSNFNISKVEGKDKILHEKERIVKESKKNMTVKNNKIVVVQYSKGIMLSEQQRVTFGMRSEKRKVDKYYENNQFLSKLNEMVNKYYSKETKQRLKTSSTYNINPTTKITSKTNTLQNSQILSYLPVPYNINISNQTPPFISQNRFSKYYELLYSNNWSLGQKNYYQYEMLSDEMIKTQLSQISYNNCFFINFIEVGSCSNDQPLKYPKRFYFKLKFYNRPQVRSQLMTINKDTGEILLLLSEQTSKILHVEIEIDAESANHYMRFIDFIEYLHNGLVNVEIVDYETGLRVGEFCLPLRGLVRKRRSEVVVQHCDVVYHNNGVRSSIKVELRAIRKMRSKQILAQASPKKAQSPIKKQQQEDKKNQPFSQENKQFNRIQRFKQQKSRREQQTHTPQKIQSNQITKILDKIYSTQKQILHVSYLKKQFLFIELNNKTDMNVIYYCSVNDEDKRWIQMNTLSLGSELTVVKDISLLQKDDYGRLTSTKKNQQKMMKCFKLNSQEQIEIKPRAKGFLLLCYQTVRRYRDIQNPIMDRQLSIYNRQRKITCSIIDDSDGCISVIHTIQIIPQPQTSEIQLQFYRPAEQQTLINLPFLDSNYFQTGIDQILIDDPFAIVMHSNYMNLPIIDRFTSKGSGIYIQTSNDIKMQDYKEYHILVLNDVAKKQTILQQSRKNDKGKSRTKLQSRIVQEIQEAGSRRLITITLRIWGCLKVAVDAKLWEEKMGTLNLSNHIFKSKGVQFFFLASEDEDTLTFSQDRKKKHQSLQLLKVTPNSATTQVSYSIVSGKTNVSFISINAINSTSVVEQQQSLKNKQFAYIQPFYRIVLILTTSVPLLKQTLKINISRTSQGTIDEPFTYRSPANKKTQFRIYSSDGELVWVKGSDSVFMMESKSQRKITISFSARRILQRASANGVCEGVILGVKWEKGIDYFGLRFNVY